MRHDFREVGLKSFEMILTIRNHLRNQLMRFTVELVDFFACFFLEGVEIILDSFDCKGEQTFHLTFSTLSALHNVIEEDGHTLSNLIEVL